MSTGNEGCRCINTSAILASLGEVGERSCQITRTNEDPEAGQQQDGIMLGVNGPCVPHTYGSSTCLQHDLLHDPRCKLGGLPAGLAGGGTYEGGGTYDQECYRPWCYVDAKECMEKSGERVYRSKSFRREDGTDMFYSYTTCDKSFDDWSLVQLPQSLGGIKIEAAIPRYMAPFMYKRNSTSSENEEGEGEILESAGSEYYDSSVPYEGALMDYFDSLMRIAEGDFHMEYTFGSQSSKRVHPTSSFTAAVQDIEDGLVDAAVGPFWITGQRLQMTSFTVPLYYDRTLLIIKMPGTEEHLEDEIGKVFGPFEPGVWFLISGFIILTALLSLWFSDRHKIAQKRYGASVRRLSHANNPNHLRKYILARLLFDEVLQKGIFFCSAGIEQDIGSSLSHKVLMFGFGFFILILVSAYVANLAAFLTRSTPITISTMEEAVKARLSICAYIALERELEAVWPTANFVFSKMEYTGVFEDFDAGKCEVLALPSLVHSPNAQLEKGLCKRTLVYTESLVIENPVAIPIQPDLAPGLSYWMYQGEKYHDISIRNSLKKYDLGQPVCNLELKDTEVDDFTQITVENLMAPIFFFTICVVVAIVVQLYHQRARSKGLSSSLGRNPSLMGLRARYPPIKSSCNSLSVAKEDDEDITQSKSIPMSVRFEPVKHDVGTPVQENFIENEVLVEQPNDFTSHVSENGNESESNDNGGLSASGASAATRLHQLVETGALDDFFACYQELRLRKNDERCSNESCISEGVIEEKGKSVHTEEESNVHCIIS